MGQAIHSMVTIRKINASVKTLSPSGGQ